jgi:hypothetical protein
VRFDGGIHLLLHFSRHCSNLVQRVSL